ncbi:hypothetical protein PoB_001483500 [Plakobranchus ocellatus]|uniref:Uncharacterized protein n=1 Tax=Plakobranchus ocellatus TaxID=259542 RepID=A0AAV3Z103_9GAST|nr:hypothetical protein PoB_001483500 [Plakobranchus ocellatus]
MPRRVLGRCTSTPALLPVLAVLSACVCLSVSETTYLRETDAISTETRDAPDKPLDIGRLLFKQMRFRDLSLASHEGVGASYPMVSRWLGHHLWRSRNSAKHTKSRLRPHNKVLKRKNKEDRLVVDNLAALLTNLKSRDTDSSLRMPSLRFG